MGFVAQEGPKNFWGVREIFKQEGKESSFTVRMQDYTKTGSRDAAAIGQVAFTAGDKSEIYSFYLFAPNGNFRAMEEYKVGKNLTILKAHSWWGCVQNAIQKECGPACLDSLGACAVTAPTVVGYVYCVAGTCGGCAIKSLACCGCNCSFLCKWAVGCCDRSVSAAQYVPSYRWGDWGVLGGTLASGPAAASWAANRLDVFFQGTDKALWHKWWAGIWSGWETLGGEFSGSPAAVSWGPNRIDVFVTGNGGNRLRHKWFDGTWHEWESLEGIQGILSSGPAAASWGENHLDVFVRGENGDLQHKRFDGRWHGWESLGGRIKGTPSAVSWGPNRIDVFARGFDDALWHKWFDGTWHEWEFLGGTLASGPAVASWAAGRLDVFARGADNALWHKWFDGRWSDWETLGGILTSAPSAVSWGPDRIDVFVRGADNGLHTRIWALQ
jgi:hypothetical protein